MVNVSSEQLYAVLEQCVPQIHQINLENFKVIPLDSANILTTGDFGKLPFWGIDRDVYTQSIMYSYCRRFGIPHTPLASFKALTWGFFMGMLEPFISRVFNLPQKGDIFTKIENMNTSVSYNFILNNNDRYVTFLHKERSGIQNLFRKQSQNILKCSESDFVSFVTGLGGPRLGKACDSFSRVIPFS